MKSSVRRILVVAVLLLVPTALWAQETRVTGQVMAEDVGQPLAGVQIMVKGTTVGTLSDGNGNFAIRVPAGATTLVFSFIGYRTLEREITGPVVNLSLSREAIGLKGITVTALGITRERRSLGGGWGSRRPWAPRSRRRSSCRTTRTCTARASVGNSGGWTAPTSA